MKPIENMFLITSTGFIITILKLGLVFVIVGLITSAILYVISDSAKALFERIFNMLKQKLKRS